MYAPSFLKRRQRGSMMAAARPDAPGGAGAARPVSPSTPACVTSCRRNSRPRWMAPHSAQAVCWAPAPTFRRLPKSSWPSIFRPDTGAQRTSARTSRLRTPSAAIPLPCPPPRTFRCSFSRVIRREKSTITATATSTRKDSRVILVLDRSDSMNHVDPVSGLNCLPHHDHWCEGLCRQVDARVRSGRSGRVRRQRHRRVPNGPPPGATVPTGSGGPDASFATSSTAGAVFTQLNAISYGGYTATAEGLSMAYIELQKAHQSRHRSGRRRQPEQRDCAVHRRRAYRSRA